jgi:hypothetical protein
MSTVPDRVLLGKGAAQKQLSISEFLLIPLDQQVEILFRGEAQFFSGTTPVRALDALKVLRQRRVEAAAAST